MTDDMTPVDPVAAYLAGVRDHAARVSEPGADAAERIGAAHSVVSRDIPRLLAAVEAAIAGHRRSLNAAPNGEHRGEHYCRDCTYDIDHRVVYVPWPCPRYEAITRALTGEDGEGT